MTLDMMTHVGELDGAHYSLGYAGHGMTMGTYLGKTVAEAMLNGNIKEHPFARFDFPNAPLGLVRGFYRLWVCGTRFWIGWSSKKKACPHTGGQACYVFCWAAWLNRLCITQKFP